MSRMTITITIDLPDGAKVALSGTPPRDEPPHPAEELHELSSGWNCPTHGGHRVVPAGTSQKTGKPYAAFRACLVRECNEKGAA